jgi:hypothetical protein
MTPNMTVRTLLVLGVVVGSGGFVSAESQGGATTSSARVATKETTRLPSTLVRAKTAFLINEAPGRATDMDFRELQAQLRKWGHFDLVDRADRADVTISLSTTEVQRAAVQSGAPVGANFVNPSRSVVRSNVSTLTIRERSSGEILWSGASGTAATALQRLQLEMPGGPRMCVAVWCW